MSVVLLAVRWDEETRDDARGTREGERGETRGERGGEASGGGVRAFERWTRGARRRGGGETRGDEDEGERGSLRAHGEGLGVVIVGG